MSNNVIDGPRTFEGEIEGPLAWRAADLSPDDWRVPIPADALAEIDVMIRRLHSDPIPMLLLTPSDFELAACRRLMTRVRAQLESGIGLAVLDRLPVETASKEALTAVYWVLSSMIARPVAQAFDGRVLYDVRDTGKLTATRVRGDLTRQELAWHTDYGFNFPPPFLGLLVLRTALEGGVSSAASMMTAHNVLAQRHPDLLRRLYQPFHWNRQGEHPEGAPETHFYPVFQYDGSTVRSRFNPPLKLRGYELAGESLDQAGREALQTMFAVMSEPAHHISWVLELGQLQFVNNFKVAHCRTEYVDHDEPDRKRHLVRIFLRDEGRRSYMG